MRASFKCHNFQDSDEAAQLRQRWERKVALGCAKLSAGYDGAQPISQASYYFFSNKRVATCQKFEE